VFDSVSPDKGCDVLYGEVNDEEWDKIDIKNFTVAHILIKRGSWYKVL